MPQAPTVSVVMSTYNAATHVGEAIESILGQTLGSWEFIIVDDGSTDSTSDIVSNYEDSRVRLEQRSHCGRAQALNRAISLARGDYIANIDADDLSLPERLEQELRFLEEHGECGLVGSARPIVIDGYGKTIEAQTRPTTDTELRKTLAITTHSSIAR